MITEEQFGNAKTGDAFIDGLGKRWVVEEIIGSGSSFALLVLTEKGEQEKLMLDEGEIIDESYAIIPELNCSEARFEAGDSE